MLGRNRLSLSVTMAASFLAAFFLADYLNCPARTAATLLIWGALLLCRNEQVRLSPASRWRIFAYSAVLALSLVLGKHLHVEDIYAGNRANNYILPYSLRDLIALFALSFALYSLLAALTAFLMKKGRCVAEDDFAASVLRQEGRRFFLLLLLLFAAWIPYLLRYFPGFVFPDSVNSIQQALGQGALNNRNPVVFTLFIRLCLWLGRAFATGDVTAGCLIFSLFQMLFCAGCFAYLICWVCRRGGLSGGWRAFLFGAYGLSPYVASNSIAMWKDPGFSAGLVVWSLLLADFAFSSGAVAKRRSWRVAYALLSLLLMFWRNNGVCAVLAAALFLLLFTVRRRKDVAFRAPLRRGLAVTVCALAIWGIVVVPVYKLCGIGTPKEETGGLMLNQMARVAAYEGEMTAEERDYLDSLLPMERYPTSYRPCCVDLLKWDPAFQYSALNGGTFTRTWFSLLLKNPRHYLEAWELETYGFWTVNRPEINTFARNIAMGAPYNLSGNAEVEIGTATLHFRNLLQGDFWADLLRCDEWSLPLGILNWLVLFVGVFLIVTGQGELLLALAPSFGLMLGLVIGTPIACLPRYEEAVQYLLPLYLLLLLRRKKA